jgi:hypothetical protein
MFTEELCCAAGTQLVDSNMFSHFHFVLYIFHDNKLFRIFSE